MKKSALKGALKGPSEPGSGLTVAAPKKLKKLNSGVQFGNDSILENAGAQSPSRSPQLQLEKSPSLVVNKAPIVTKKSSIRPSMRLTEEDDQKIIAAPKKSVVWNSGESSEAAQEAPVKPIVPLTKIQLVEPKEEGAETHRGGRPNQRPELNREKTERSVKVGAWDDPELGEQPEAMAAPAGLSDSDSDISSEEIHASDM